MPLGYPTGFPYTSSKMNTQQDGRKSLVTQKNFITEWRTWIEAFVINDIKKALDKDMLEVSLIILSLLGTECLSAYWSGTRDSNSGTFSKFIGEYFPPAYKDYSKAIYRSLRNGLFHNYVPVKIKIDSKEIMPFVMQRNKNEPHLVPCKSGQRFPVYFNREIFARDFLAAWDKFSADLDQKPQLVKNVVARARKGFLIVGDISKFVS
jgi:hypothetical protein